MIEVSGKKEPDSRFGKWMLPCKQGIIENLESNTGRYPTAVMKEMRKRRALHQDEVQMK
jgi:hypothetical protein